ncbi:hypothetical protein ES705_44973 [subsurface metagenome]
MDALELIARHIDLVESQAEKSLAHRKYMMYGYYKAVAVHLRKIARQIRKLDNS